MKATGMVRRVDDLGRIIIPKEIRKSMNIQEGDAMEIFLEDNCIVFQKVQEKEMACEHLNETIEILNKKNEHEDLQVILEQIYRIVASSEMSV